MTHVQDDKAGGSTVYATTSDDSARACPSCGVFATRLKDYRTTTPRHLPCGGRPVSIRWRKTRWYCTEDLCTRSSFTEAIPAVPARMRTTTALRQAAGAALGFARGRGQLHHPGSGAPAVHARLPAAGPRGVRR